MNNNITSPADRIGQLPDLLHLSTKEFCEPLGVSTQMFSQYKNGKAKPGYDFITAVVAQYPVSADWLLLGEGDWHSESIVSDVNVRYKKQDFNYLEVVDRLRALEQRVNRLYEQRKYTEE